MNLADLQSAPFRVYGDLTFRGKCPREEVEQVTFFGHLREQYPSTWGAIGFHPKNEMKRTAAQIRAVRHDKAEGFLPGASDIIIPGAPTLVIEMKRQDYTQCSWQDGQVEFLTAAHNAGAFACVAFGYDAAWKALQDWIDIHA